MSDFGMTLAVIGWLGTAVSMLIHIVGTLLGWWPSDGTTWVIPLLFICVMMVGGRLAHSE